MRTNYDAQRKAGFLCRVRKYRDEDTARRVLWAIRQNGRTMEGCRPKYCNLCLAWHIVKER